MENNPHCDPNADSTRPEEPELDLYSIPSYSSWFAWNDIHETEGQALKEFFEGSSILRTPKIYKEYRDFIINKYREDPSRRVTFTEIRKSLVGDITLLHKVFLFLETWGLINFVGPPRLCEGSENDDRVQVEEGAPNGVRVVATPNSLRPLSAPVVKGKNSGGGVVEGGMKLPPLASYLDVFGDLKRLHCGNCEDNCDSEYYEYIKDNFVVCVKCFKSGNYGVKSMDDFKLKNRGDTDGTVWTEAEIILLLDSVSKHGDDWDLVARNVQTKSKLGCITKLIELPFGESLIDSAMGRGSSGAPSMDLNSVKPVPVSSSEHQKNITNKDQGYDDTNENEQNGDSENQELFIIQVTGAYHLNFSRIQLKKVHSKIKYCEDAELLMEKEYAAIKELKECILGQRTNTFQRTFNAGISKLREHGCIQSQTGKVSE